MAEYILIRVLPGGAVMHQPPQAQVRYAARSAGLCLYDNVGVVKATAQKFGAELSQKPIGAWLSHESGYRFRILRADHTVDGVALTPGMRVFNYYDHEWGTLPAEQFAADGMLNPGGECFNGWYDFVSEDGVTRLLNGERLSTRPPQT